MSQRILMREGNGEMAHKKKKAHPIKSPTVVNLAAEISASIGATRKGRDSLTRVQSPIKVTDTNARQWNRYSV